MDFEYAGKLTNLKKAKLIPTQRFNFLLPKANSKTLTRAEQTEINDLSLLIGLEVPVCPSCDVPMLVKHGRKGYFYGCPNYFRPSNCKRTANLDFLQLRKRARVNEPDWPEDEAEVAREKREASLERHARNRSKRLAYIRRELYGDLIDEK